MKKVLLFVAVVAFIGTTSCKKDYDCECTDGTTTPIDNAKKADAEEACDAISAVKAIGGDSCSLK